MWHLNSQFYTDPKRKPDPGGHAVVLVRCEPNCLMFMNSWGQKWGDRGFFCIKNAKVLQKKFHKTLQAFIIWTTSVLNVMVLQK